MPHTTTLFSCISIVASPPCQKVSVSKLTQSFTSETFKLSALAIYLHQNLQVVPYASLYICWLKMKLNLKTLLVFDKNKWV